MESALSPTNPPLIENRPRATTPAVGRNFRALTTLTALFTYLLIVIGGIVRVTGSGDACPDWPLCHGQLIPPLEEHILIEYSHRLVTLLVSFTLLPTVVIAITRYRAHRILVRAAIAALALLFLQAGIGGAVVLLKLQPISVALHLANAMLVLASVLTLATLTWRTPNGLDRRASTLFPLVLASAGAIYLLIISGAWVAGSGASSACSSLPLCDGGLLPTGALQVIHMLHRIFAGAVGILVIYTCYRIIQHAGADRAVFTIAVLGALLFITQVFVGAANVWLDFPPLLAGLHLALAAALWGVFVVLTVLLRPVPPAEATRGETSVTRTSLRASAADYFALTKPWIVALLLTTTLCGMLIAARGLPPLDILLFTLVGGVCAAGGANALNSYIDRETDKQMGRTARRPLPTGRLEARRALIFALILCALAPLILGLGVNWLSAALAVVGIIYYAFIYTVLLKRATPQNIVIGGAAGAIPPLVGWAAVTNDISLLALYLFTIIFLWTPPHTWALMLLLDKDYKRVKIPMLPAAWGQLEARRQIILYSVLLVVISLLPVSIRQLGWLYLAGALVLGAYFLALALALWRAQDGYKVAARRLYRFSNIYLALLFLAMVLDQWSFALRG